MIKVIVQTNFFIFFMRIHDIFNIKLNCYSSKFNTIDISSSLSTSLAQFGQNFNVFINKISMKICVKHMILYNYNQLFIML